MKVQNKHRRVFRQVLERIHNYDCSWICHHINDITELEPELGQECKNILFYYFKDHPNQRVLWILSPEDSYEDCRNARIIALYSLIYAPL